MTGSALNGSFQSSNGVTIAGSSMTVSCRRLASAKRPATANRRGPDPREQSGQGPGQGQEPGVEHSQPRADVRQV